MSYLRIVHKNFTILQLR